jgi:hypothetical protein
MVRVQSGISPSVASALVAAVKSSGALGPWNGAWAFALKVSTASRILHCVVLFAFYIRGETRSLAACDTVQGMFFTPGQVAAWRACEQYYGAKIHAQDLGQQCCTFAVGAVAGTFCAAIPTKIFR